MATPVQNPENAALVRQATERHQAALLRYAANLLGGDTARARTVVDGVFAALGALPPGEVGDDLMEWLFATARWRTLALMRREGLMQRSGDGSAGVAAGDGAGEGESPHQAMQRLISRLTPKQQEAVRLKFQHGFTLPEVARITELSPYSVSLLVHNAVAHIGQDFPVPEGAAAPVGLSDDPRLTAYALGEMEPAERKAFEAAHFDLKTAAAQVTEIRRLTTQMTQTLAVEAGAPAPRGRRRRARRQLPAWVRSGRFWLVFAVLAVLTGGTGLWVRIRSGPATATKPAQAIDFRLKPAKWNEPGAVAEERTGRTAGGPAGADAPLARGNPPGPVGAPASQRAGMTARETTGYGAAAAPAVPAAMPASTPPPPAPIPAPTAMNYATT
ncbi:MAG: sigma-70 family RNA polymerase sigma factor, partial [Opitutales bacterium]